MVCPEGDSSEGVPSEEPYCFNLSARNRNRTCTGLRQLDPEPSVSTNFTIRAYIKIMIINLRGFIYIVKPAAGWRKK